MAHRVFAALLATIAVVNADTVYLTASLTEVCDTCSSSIWSMDTESGDMTQLIDLVGEDLGAYSGAKVCDNVYYSVWFKSGDFGLFSLDLETMDYQKTHTDFLFHKLACDPSNSTLVGAASRVDGSFVVATWDASTSTSSIVGEFPDTVVWNGYDNIFQFSEDGKQLWASWPLGPIVNLEGRGGGTLYIMDTTSGEISAEYSYPAGPPKSQPLFALPSDLATTFHGVMWYPAKSFEKEDHPIDVYWADYTLDGTNIIVNRTQDVYDYMWSNSQAPLVCGGTLYSLDESGAVKLEVHSLSLVDVESGNLLKSLDLKSLDNKDWGGLAC